MQGERVWSEVHEDLARVNPEPVLLATQCFLREKGLQSLVFFTYLNYLLVELLLDSKVFGEDVGLDV